MDPRETSGFTGIRKFIAILCGLSFLYATWMGIQSLRETDEPIGSATVPAKHADGQVRIHDMNRISATAQALQNREKVLILTPVARFYEEYWSNLLSLTYPRELIELGFIVPDDSAGDAALRSLENAVKAVQLSPDAKKRFARVTILRQDTPSIESHSEQDRHSMEVQTERRKYMSLARNSLLFTTLQSDTSWVLWLDSDIVETPRTLIEDMTKHNKDLLVANAYQRYTEKGEHKIRPYDYNSWIDSPTAQDLAKNMGPDEVLYEGYSEMATYRTLMAHLYSESGDKTDEIELDGVGGTALLVKAEVHRDGAMFPPFAFYHLIETEGFAKMAKRLGYHVYGLPNYLVFHYNE